MAEDLSITVIPFMHFIPLIKDVAEVASKVAEIYSSAKHNKRITKLLLERISAANGAVSILREEEVYTKEHYINLQRLVKVLNEMEQFSRDITQYNKLQKFLGAKSIETQFTGLCEEYDTSINILNLTLMVDSKARAERESKILHEDIQELARFQSALAESMADANKKLEDVGKGTKNTNEKMNQLVEMVSQMSMTMQRLETNDNKNQKTIDEIFNESPLPFEDYEETGIIKSERLRKFVHVRLREDYAFKTVEKEQVNTVKNQVTILKKLKECQNIIHFYGYTQDESSKNYYLITEWAEKGNLREYILENRQEIGIKTRLGFAYDIAKGLNFLNVVKFVHRDIRAENIVITDREVAKITNFKLSRGIGEATSNLAVNKECARYTSPEILERGSGDKKKKYDTKCEVYSFGVLLWEIAECKPPFEQEEDFIEITNKVKNGYREPFSPDTGIPKEYQDLVYKAVNKNSISRPTFSKMLIELQDIFNNYNERPLSQPSTPKTINPPQRSNSLIPNFNWDVELTVEQAIEEHKKDLATDKSRLYKCFDTYANMGNPKAQYWKAYYISKGLSDLKCDSPKERDKIVAELYKSAADYGNEVPDAQLRYALMVMQGRGVKQNKSEAIDYLIKAAENGQVMAMYNVANYYFSSGNKELGRFYMMMAAKRKYPEAIEFCKKNGISYQSG